MGKTVYEMSADKTTPSDFEAFAHEHRRNRRRRGTLSLDEGFGVYWRLATDTFVLCGFIIGMALGLMLAIPRCRRTLREINALREAVQTDDGV